MRADLFRRDAGASAWMAAALLATVAVLGLSLLLGRYPEPYLTSPGELAGDELAWRLVLHLRLPRVLAAFMTGMVLSACGCVLQMVFRNPLVDSGFLGVGQGAGFGAVLAIVVLGGAPAVVQTSAGVFALGGLAASYAVARRVQVGGWVLRLLLAGIAVSAIYSSATGVLKSMADPLDQLPDVTFWLLGGLWAVTWDDVIHLLPLVVPGMVVLWLMRWRLNLLAMRDDTALSLGAAPGRERALLLAAAVLPTAAVVSVAGLVGWVGLIVPHVARRLLGADAQRALPGSMLLGGVFTLLCDDVARVALPGEIPLGILTSLGGAAVFLALLLRRRVELRR